MDIGDIFSINSKYRVISLEELKDYERKVDFLNELQCNIQEEEQRDTSCNPV